MLLDLRTDIKSTATTSNIVIIREADTGHVAQLLIDVCIAFAVLETFFIAAFILSWHFNRDNNSNNTKGLYALILTGYIFCFGGVVIGICTSFAPNDGSGTDSLQ
jgi:uncharacterized membrane protein YedE/YeeE